MRKFFAFLSLALAVLIQSPASGQIVAAAVVPQCTIPPFAYEPGNNRQITQDTNGNLCIALSDGLPVTASRTSVGNVVAVPMSGESGGSFQITSVGTSNTIQFEQSNDSTDGINGTWGGLAVRPAGSTNAFQTSANAVGTLQFYTASTWVRARISAYGSGTVTITVVRKNFAIDPFIHLATSTASIGTVSVASGTIINAGSGFTDSTAALAISGTFTGTGRAGNTGVSFFTAQAYADQAGTLFIDLSLDTGATYFPVASVAVTAATYQTLQTRITGAISAATLYRVRYVNGGVAQTVFRLSSSYTQ